MSDDTPITISGPGGLSVETTLGAIKAAGDAAAKSTIPPRADASDLAATIERARALLDDGDYQAALLLSTGAYEQAKAAAGYAEKVKASRQLIDKARRMQAEALKIESVCYVAMANAVDEAQAKGQVAKPGQKANVPGSDIFTLDDVGVDRRRLLEARKLRDAEAKEPGIVERAIEARLSQGLEPSRANLRAAVGTASASKEDRGDNFYQTPACATRTLLAFESFSPTIWESSCGLGAISRVLEEAGYEVVLTDLVDRQTVTQHGELQGVGDFLASQPEAPGEGHDICTNPPYGEVLNDYVAHALRVHKPRKMALLLNLNFLCGFDDDDRNFVMDDNPPARVYVFKRRLPMMHREGWDGKKASSRMNTAWFVWERQDDGSYGDTTVIKRVDWKDYEEADALEPGEGGNASGVRFEEFKRETPRKTVDERVEEEFVRAFTWMKDLEPFDVVKFRQGVGLRHSVAAALIDALSANGLIEPTGDGQWLPTGKGMNMIATVGAVEATKKLKAGAPLDEVLA
ncbi:hypothetical protein [Rhizobium lentis]|uniref:hypothetical protein n=1 Tax=Rhizobium lentis TaxID=1138194 RepID=UPI001C83DC1E|nr:hypothetical protein [Rhizobium lentis]